VLAIFAAVAGGLMLMIGSAYMYYRLEWKAIVICALLVGISLVIAPRVVDVPILAAPFLMGCAGGYTIKNGKSFKFYILTTSISLAVIFTGFFYYMMIYQNVDFIGMLRDEMVKFMSMAGAPEDIKNGMLSEFDSSRNDIIARVPFSAFLNSLFLSALGYSLIKRFFSRTAQAGPGAGLEAFRLNDYFIFVLIAGLAAILLIDKSVYPIAHNGGLNVVLIAALLYFVQALGVVKFILIRRGIPGYVLPLAVTAILIAGMGAALFLLILLAGVGALDVWADFRKLISRNETEG
jgi:hypothetical protein